MLKYPCPLCQYDVDDELKCPECGAHWIVCAYGVFAGLSDHALKMKWRSGLVGLVSIPILVVLLACMVDASKSYLPHLSSFLLLTMSALGLLVLRCFDSVRSPYRLLFLISASRILGLLGIGLFPIVVWFLLATGWNILAWTTVSLVLWLVCLVVASTTAAVAIDNLCYKKNYTNTILVKPALIICAYMGVFVVSGFVFQNQYLFAFSFCAIPVLLMYIRFVSAIYLEKDRRDRECPRGLARATGVKTG